MNLRNSTFDVKPSTFDKKDIFIPTSKSYANRLLILAAICKDSVILRNLPESTDVLTMIGCLKRIGVSISGGLNELTIKNSFPECEPICEEALVLETGDGGTTNRFLMGLLSLGNNPYIIEPTERMKERPAEQFIQDLARLNVSVSKLDDGRILVKGPIDDSKGEIEVDCQKSTQFASAILMSLLYSDTKVIPKNLDTSSKYFEITKRLCHEFRQGIREFTAPLDFSSFGYPIALAAIAGKLKLSSFSGVDDLQADSQILEILKKMGGEVRIVGNELEVVSTPLKSIDLDCSDFPDLVPTIAFLCSYAKGKSCLKGVRVLRYKESDRIEEVMRILEAFNISYSFNEQKDEFFIEGRSDREAKPISLETAKDHRMIMLAYLFMKVNGGGRIYHTSHINKSYPHFLEAMS